MAGESGWAIALIRPDIKKHWQVKCRIFKGFRTRELTADSNNEKHPEYLFHKTVLEPGNPNHSEPGDYNHFSVNRF